MNLRTLLGWSLAASLLAACSGGGAGSMTPSNGTTGPTGNVSFTINPSQLQSSSRSAKFIGTNVDTVAYSFTPGPINGTLAIPAGCTTNAGPPVSYTCTIALAPNTYNLTITLKHGATSVGTGNAVGIIVASGATTPAAVNVAPILATNVPALSVTEAQPTQFYLDGNAQTINLTANELDAAGDIITTFYGPVGNWQTLTWANSGGTTNVGLPASIAAAPAIQAGSNAEGVTFTGVGPNASSLTVTLSDGVNTSSVVLPYVSLANNSNNPAPGQITLATTGAPGAQTVLVTESTTAASGGLDATVNSTTTCGAHATITASSVTTAVPGANQLTIAGANGTVTYTVQAVDATIANCNLVVTSAQDANLKNTIQINFPGAAGVGVNSHSRGN